VVFALRQMMANRSLTLAIVLTLGLGIGATTAIFSVVHTVLLRPLPYADPDRIVVLWETFREFTQGRASPGHYHDWAEQSMVLEATAAHQARTYTLAGDADPERILAARVTPEFFRVQSMPPAAGRYFLPEEGRPGARVAVLSYELWQRRFGGDAGVVGREVELSGEPHLVVGVAPRAFTLTDFDERLWTPLSFEPDQRANYGSHSFLVLAKLKPGVTLERAQSDLDRVTAGIRERHPDEMQNRGINVQPLLGTLVAGYRTQLWVLLGAVAFVLLIACGNVASLLLARAPWWRISACASSLAWGPPDSRG
jgi:predicted permease